MNKVRITLACTAVLTGAANANLIVNGSFEQSSLNPGGAWSVLGGGDTSIDGWTTVGGGIDYFGTIITASEGIHSIDLNNVSAGGGIAQTFATTVGWIYTVEFDMSANMYGGPTPKVLRVHAAGDAEDFEFDYVAAGATAADPAWERMTWSFTATGSSTNLWFEGISGGVYGAALDNVVVTGVAPTPGTLAGFGALGLLVSRRRRG
ncbi:MAG: choice-of-anchor C family protein [Phycisphaerales bacterium]|nr:choice-of-anchor C family protein [Phycisphaerales bacterium]